MNLNKMWINITSNRKCKRNIREIEYNSINIKEYLVIDVRSRREFKEGHLNSAINIPLSDIRKNIDKYIRDKDKKILVYCEYGIRSKQAVEIMENLGYTQVYNLKEGLENI